LGAVILPSRKPHNVRTPRTDPAGAPGRRVIVQLPSASWEARLAPQPTGGSRRNACSSGCSSGRGPPVALNRSAGTTNERSPGGSTTIANAAPQSLAPFLGAILLTVGAGHN